MYAQEDPVGEDSRVTVIVRTINIQEQMPHAHTAHSTLGSYVLRPSDLLRLLLFEGCICIPLGGVD